MSECLAKSLGETSDKNKENYNTNPPTSDSQDVDWLELETNNIPDNHLVDMLTQIKEACSF